MKARMIPAGEFKAKCLALFDEVAATGETLIITKRGKPVARILPPEEPENIRAFLRNSIAHVGDIETPLDNWADWDPERGFKP